MRFGTDGIRGLANRAHAEIALALGRAAARLLAGPGGAVALGRDTRRSGPMLAAAFAAGATAEGCEVIDLGVAPTPAVAWLSAKHAVAGAVVSASHNPYDDNGIKLFAAGGTKLDGETEAAVEEALHQPPTGPAPIGVDVGLVTDGHLEVGRWADAVVATLDGRHLVGLRVVVDAAHGAASSWAARVLERLGAEVLSTAAEPDGSNINAGVGATHPDALAAAVRAAGADLGLALDGDADRCLAIDATGALVDGDQILAVLALDRRASGRLPHDTVVVTVMSNLGFRQAMAGHGIAVLDTPVGDKHVLATLEEGGFALGGEQSGHVIQRDLATTGDGLLTGVHLADVVVRSGRSLADLASVMTRLPQVLRNVRLARPVPDLLDRLAGAVAAAEAELGDGGRVLLRPSGTEPVVRVMVEAPTEAAAAAVAATLAGAVEAAAG